MRKALAAENNRMSKASASKLYNVPRTTLIYKCSGKYPVER